MPHTNISSAESRYREKLMSECRKLFLSSPMPSHDHLHHARVWENAAVILERLYDKGLVSDPLIADKAIIAAFFHDTGLTQNREADHGKQSREICREFLENTDLPVSDRQEILDAVEKHDDKEYRQASAPGSLAAILTVADDIDAFGCVGISRYAEIYSMRGIPVNEMASKIIANATSRLNHLADTYAIFPDLVEEQRKKADTLISYYKNFIP